MLTSIWKLSTNTSWDMRSSISVILKTYSKAEGYILPTKDLANSRIIHPLWHLASLTTTCLLPPIQNRSQATRMSDHVMQSGTRPQEMGTPFWRGWEGGQLEARKRKIIRRDGVQLRSVPTAWLGTARPTPATPSYTGDFNEGIRKELSYTVTRMVHKIVSHWNQLM